MFQLLNQTDSWNDATGGEMPKRPLQLQRQTLRHLTHPAIAGYERRSVRILQMFPKNVFRPIKPSSSTGVAALAAVHPGRPASSAKARQGDAVMPASGVCGGLIPGAGCLP